VGSVFAMGLPIHVTADAGFKGEIPELEAIEPATVVRGPASERVKVTAFSRYPR